MLVTPRFGDFLVTIYLGSVVERNVIFIIRVIPMANLKSLP